MGLSSVNNQVMGGHRKDRVKLFSEVYCGRMRGGRHKLETFPDTWRILTRCNENIFHHEFR